MADKHPAGTDDPEALHRRAAEALVRGEPLEAIACWHRAIDLAPGFAAAHGYLAEACLAVGDFSAAESAFRRRIELEPEEPRAWVGLGRMLHRCQRPREAESALARALEVGRESSRVCYWVGGVQLEAGELDAALDLFQRAAGKDPGDANVHVGAGVALQLLSRPGDAESAYRRALAIDSSHAPALKHLGVLLQERGDLQAAADCFRRLLDAQPRDGVARHMLAACTGETTASAPEDYVVRLFDDYADRFDAHLAEISYRVPELLSDAARELAGAHRPGWRVLDLGCGTGRCGEAIRPLAGFLAGVDLSPRMIAKSRERGVYDSLEVGSITDALSATGEPFDLILAGDVFIYVGELRQVFAGCARSLNARGLLAFSIEQADGDGYGLLPTGRYAHSVTYIETVAAASALSPVYRRDIVVREDPEPIAGQIIVLAKKDGK